MTQGEKNTKYFYASVVVRRRQNQITQLKDETGSWCIDETELKRQAYNFYIKLYTKEQGTNGGSARWAFPPLPRASVQWMNREVSDHEVKPAMFQLGPYKAARPNGLPTIFFQKHWTWVGRDTSRFVKEIFRIGVVPEDMDHSMICLIPKKPHPGCMAQFRPICLNYVVIKVITKIIANRLKPLMKDLVGHNQPSFKP